MHSAGLLLKAFALTVLAVAASTEAMPQVDAVIEANAPNATAPPLPKPACATLPNKDRLGFDLTNVRGNVQSCDATCKAVPACATWSWSNHNGGTCWLKSRAGKIVDKAGVTTTECTFNAPQVCNAFKDIDFVGMDIANKPGKSAGDCCDLCNEYSGCTAYAWSDFNGGTCWLKKAVGQVEYKVGVTSSSLLPLYGGVCPVQYNIDYEGNDIGNKPAKDSGLCCGICKANKDCKAYTWSNHNGGTCWMKSGKGKTVAKAGVTSGTIAIF